MDIANNLLPEVIEVPYLEHEVEENTHLVKQVRSSNRNFIEANTIPATLDEIKEQHIIPSWAKTNEPLISHSDFVEHTYYIVKEVFHGEQIIDPSVRLSHPVKGRTFEARNLPAHLLQDNQKTLWYQRMMFCIEIPSIQAEIDGNILNLTIGGVKSFSEDNLYQNSNGDQHFQIFIGFKNKVCTNLCLWTDGLNRSVAVKGLSGLIMNIHSLIKNYNSSHHLYHLERLTDYSLTEEQFAYMVGKLRMYQFLPSQVKKDIPEMLLTDQHINAVVKYYYRDKSFCKNGSGNISLWKLYNLFTGANKSSYIDSFVIRSVNAYNFVEGIKHGLDSKGTNWYLPS